jgi:hypothetical protein
MTGMMADNPLGRQSQRKSQPTGTDHMAVSTTYQPLVFNGNGSTTVFSITWQFFDADDLTVIAIDGDGVETVQTISTHYTVSGGTDANGLPGTGAVTMVTAPASGTTLRVERSTDQLQSTVWTISGPFQAKSVEAGLDRVTLIAQESGSAGSVNDGFTGDVMELNSAGATDYWDAESRPIRYLATPTENTEAATKLYVDGLVSDAALNTDLGVFTQNGAGAVNRSWVDKVRDLISVKDFGAVGDGVTPDNDAVDTMIAAVGFARFSPGAYAITTDTFDSPLVFDYGAHVVVPTSNTLTVTARIEAPRYYIFRGDGSYSFAHDVNSGEDSKHLHASWFGAFPTNTTTTNQAPFIQKAIDSLGNTREGIIYFDNGNYHISSAMTVNRGISIKGIGTRRTVFRADADGFNMFTTAGEGVRFEGVQFEPTTSIITEFDGQYIRIVHDRCEVYDVQMLGPAVSGIYVAANDVRIVNIGANWGVTPPSGAAFVHIAEASNGLVQNVRSNISSNGPEALIKLGGAGVVSGIKIQNVSHVCASMSVLLDASAADIGRIVISGISSEVSSGTAPTYAIKLATGASYDISDVMIADVTINSYPTNGILIDQSSSGVTEDVSFSNVSITGSSGVGIQLTRSAGTLREINIGDTVNLTDRATPIGYSGTMTEVRVSPLADPGAYPAMCYDFTVADDSVVTLPLRRTLFTGILMVSAGSPNYGQWVIRAASTPVITAMITPSTNVNATTGVLNGTTGTDTKLTVSVDNGFIYVENRLGTSQRVNVVVLAGIA